MFTQKIGRPFCDFTSREGYIEEPENALNPLTRGWSNFGIITRPRPFMRNESSNVNLICAKEIADIKNSI
jgi:hypothetical protein